LFHAPVLYCISDPSSGDPVELLLNIVSRRIEFFQFRHKQLASAERAVIAGRLAQSHRQATRLLINGLDQSWATLDIDGVHLPSSQEIQQARSILPAKIVGASAHTPDEAVRLSQEGADYVLLAPIFPAFSKQQARKPLGLRLLYQACRNAGSPIIALGGMTSDRFREVLDTGAAGIAGISLFADPARLDAVVAKFRECA
jgi:thiamine-phosphate diphosphorylase